jgi:hypothetical protein
LEILEITVALEKVIKIPPTVPLTPDGNSLVRFRALNEGETERMKLCWG